MNINQATDYGFRAVLFLAEQERDQLVEAQVIARQVVIPMRFLLKIMPSLIKAGIIKSQRGAGGGYTLAKDAGEISLLDILEAIEGPIRLNRCLIDYDLCTREAAPGCKVHQALEKIQARLADDLAGCRIADLL